MRSGPFHWPAVLLAWLLVVAGVAACVPEPGRADPCEWMRKPPPAGTAAGRTVVLVDVSNSTRSTTAKAGSPDFTAALREHLDQALERRDVVSIGSFSGPGAEPVWVGPDLTTDYSRPNEDNEKARRKTAAGCLEKALGEAVRAAPAVPGTDVLGALRAAGDRMRDRQEGKTVVMATDGLTTSGCADLTRAGFDGPAEIENIRQVCLERSEVRAEDLRDARLVMRGIGRPSVDQPVPSPVQLQWLEVLWRQLCRASGVADDKCEITSGAVAGAVDASPPPAVPDVADPPVAFSGKSVTYEVPGDILFDTSSAELRPEARATLARIAVDIRTRRYSAIEVRGHTDSRASTENSERLGQRRADAVAALLSDSGLSGLVARSYGESRLKCPAEFPEGVEDPVALQCNRRVEIVVTLA